LRVRLLILGLCSCTLSGCGGSSRHTSGNLRFVQALAGTPSLALYHNRTLIAANLAYSNATAYFTINSGDGISAVPAGSSSAILNTNVSITSGGNETLILTGSGSSTKTVLLTDGGTTAVTGDGHVRVVNAASSIGSPDVYIVPAGTNITGLSPTASMQAFGTDTGYQLVPTGNNGGAYEVIMTAPGTKNAFLDTGPLALSSSSSNQTVVVLDGTSTGFSFTALTDQ
jgi:hypothetical protein